MTPKQADLAKFTAAMFVVLLAVTVAFVYVLEIRLPWEEPPPPPSEPREFDLSSLKTMVRQFDAGRGLVAVQSLADVDAAGRCAVVVESMEQPTPVGYHYVFNALERPTGVVTAYPVQTAQLEQLVQDCRAAGAAGDGVAESAQDVLSAMRLAILAAEKAKAEAERENESDDEKSNPLQDAVEQVQEGELSGVNKVLEGVFKK